MDGGAVHKHVLEFVTIPMLHSNTEPNPEQLGRFTSPDSSHAPDTPSTHFRFSVHHYFKKYTSPYTSISKKHPSLSNFHPLNRSCFLFLFFQLFDQYKKHKQTKTCLLSLKPFEKNLIDLETSQEEEDSEITYTRETTSTQTGVRRSGLEHSYGSEEDERFLEEYEDEAWDFAQQGYSAKMVLIFFRKLNQERKAKKPSRKLFQKEEEEDEEPHQCRDKHMPSKRR
jgi:hypothetical protein